MGKRISLSFNENKVQDKIILDYLEKQYSESDFIKAMLYKLAIIDYGGDVQNVLNGTIRTDEILENVQNVQVGTKRTCKNNESEDETTKGGTIRTDLHNTYNEYVEAADGVVQNVQVGTKRTVDKSKEIEDNILNEFMKYNN